jgi:enolase
MRIKSLSARRILDSRGQWTVEATLEFKNGVRTAASVPQGKSTGSHEMCALPADAAVRKINNVIAPRIKRQDFRSQAAFDDFLIKLDGTPERSKLGANAMLALSIAFLRAEAVAKNVPLWRHIFSFTGTPWSKRADRTGGIARPRLFMNMVNGGLHAGNNLDFQEYLVIPKCGTIRESVETGTQIYHKLGEALARAKGKGARNLGDEGGYAPNFKDNAEPFRILHAVVKKLKLGKKVDFGMDAAASDIKKKSDIKLGETYIKLARQYGLIYIEDPFSEEDFLSFAALNMHFAGKIRIAGDDLTTTNVRRMELAHAEGSVNAVIVKPNQIGTVTETLDAVRLARKYGWAVVVSHRSGETNDDFIADFAYGVGAEGLKLGAPARGERVAKYNRLLEIESHEDR